MKKPKTFWLAAAVLYSLAVSPNAMIIKLATNEADPYYWNFVRFLIVLIICLPFIIRHWRVLTSKKAIRWVFGSAIFMTIAVIAYTFAIKLSLASYVSIITLINPIVLVLISPLFTKERISHRAIAGITLAALGAMTIVFVPIALYQNNIAFYPMATFLALVNCVAYTLSIIFIRKADEHGAPLTGSIGVNALVTVIASYILFNLFGDTTQAPLSSSFLLAALYSGAVIGIFTRVISVKILENVGTAFTSVLMYFEIFLTILLPILVLGEQLSLFTVFGGMLILLGIYVVESHKHSHIQHHFTWRHH